RRGQEPHTGRGRRARRAAHEARQGPRLPHLRQRRPRLLLGEPGRLSAGGGDRRMGTDLGVLRQPPRGVGATAMCTYQTTTLRVRGSGKGPHGWFALSVASVYFDHPVHTADEHTLNIDLLNPSRGPGERVAIELDATSARALADAILLTLDAVPEALREG